MYVLTGIYIYVYICICSHTYNIAYTYSISITKILTHNCAKFDIYIAMITQSLIALNLVGLNHWKTMNISPEKYISW